jgi:hypothetical protein
MLNSLITSQTRIKLLLKFFMNSSTRAHLRGLEAEFGESTNGIRVELNRLEEAKLLVSAFEGNKKLYQANRKHPLFNDIHNLVLKETGIDRAIERVVRKTGNLYRIYLTGDFARGRNSRVIELILIGDNIDLEYLDRKIVQSEKIAGRKIKCSLYGREEAKKVLADIDPGELVVLWGNGG